MAPHGGERRRFSELNNLRYLTADLKEPWVDIHFDIQRAPLPSASFDVIICSHVLEHVADDRRAMRELFRLLRPGGWAHLQVPIHPYRRSTLEDRAINTAELRQRHYWGPDHVRLYGLDYFERLAEAGFVVETVSMPDIFKAAELELFGIAAQEDLIFGLKPPRRQMARARPPNRKGPSARILSRLLHRRGHR
jgi:SAM-dependent methyltransferase